jgi:hypothetical protein
MNLIYPKKDVFRHEGRGKVKVRISGPSPLPQDEIGRTWLEGLPAVTDDEQEDIERRYGKLDGPMEIGSRETVDICSGRLVFHEMLKSF